MVSPPFSLHNVQTTSSRLRIEDANKVEYAYRFERQQICKFHIVKLEWLKGF